MSTALESKEPSPLKQSSAKSERQAATPLINKGRAVESLPIQAIRFRQTIVEWWKRTIVSHSVWGIKAPKGTPEGEKPIQLYLPLSPVSTVSQSDIEMRILLDAFSSRQKKSIYNIGITGPYGSGKSSLIQSFLKVHSDVKPTMVSLANFRLDVADDKEAEDIRKDIEKGTTRFQIETEILQQILYSADGDDLPSSRFQRIPKQSRFQGFIVTVVLAALFGLLGVWGAIAIWETLAQGDVPFLWRIGIFVISTLGFFPIARTLGRQVRRLFATIGKVRLTQIEVDLEKDAKASMLNEAIDEIIHYFEQTKSNCLIIEDLDRYGSVDLFTSLRELSDILRRSPRTKSLSIVFIYAVKDELFKDETRTKFFDVIIPVKPHTSKFNSHEQLAALNMSMGLGISSEAIHDLATFVESSRVVISICNELRVAKGEGFYDLDIDKLFALTLYKNLFPADYAELLQGRGVVVEVFNSIEEVRRRKLNKLGDKIEQLKSCLPELQYLQTLDEESLKAVYISRLLATYNHRTSNYWYQFKISNLPVSAEETNDQIFDRLRIAKQVNGQLFAFDTWQFQVNEKAYDELVNRIGERGATRTQQLRDEITATEKEIAELRTAQSSSLYQFVQVESEEDSYNASKDRPVHQQQLARFLIRNGYVTDDFYAYVVSRNEGHFTHVDHAFMLNVKLDREMSVSAELQVEKVFEALKSGYFKSEHLVHHGIVQHAAQNPGDDKSIILANSLDPKSQRTREAVSKALDSFREEHEISTLVDWLVRNNPCHAEYLSQRENDSEVAGHLVEDLQQFAADDLNNVELPITRAFVERQSQFLDTARDSSNAADVALALGVKWDTQNLSNLGIPLVARIRKADLLVVCRDTIKHFAELEANKRYTHYEYVVAELLSNELPDVLSYVKRHVEWFFSDLVGKPPHVEIVESSAYLTFASWKTQRSLPDNKHIVQLLPPTSIYPVQLESTRWSVAIESNKLIHDWTTADQLLREEEIPKLLGPWLERRGVQQSLMKLDEPWQVDRDILIALVEGKEVSPTALSAIAPQLPQMEGYVPDNIDSIVFIALAKADKLSLTNDVLDWAEQNAPSAGRYLLLGTTLIDESVLEDLLTRPLIAYDALAHANRLDQLYAAVFEHWLHTNATLPTPIAKWSIKKVIDAEYLEISNDIRTYLFEQASGNERLATYLGCNIIRGYRPKLEMVQTLPEFDKVGPGLGQGPRISADDAHKTILAYLKQSGYISSFKPVNGGKLFKVYNKDPRGQIS